MAKDKYCIVDNTINSDISIEGLTAFTYEEASDWIYENQVVLDQPLVVGDITHIHKFGMARDNWPESEV